MTQSLDDLSLPSRTVSWPDAGDFTVYGISFSDISMLVADYGPSLTKLYNLFVAEKDADTLTAESVNKLLEFALREMPEAVALTIALAAGSKNPRALAKAKVAKMPIPVQVEAIEKVMALTFISEAEVKKLVEAVIRMMESVTSALPTPSPAGNGSFASR